MKQTIYVAKKPVMQNRRVHQPGEEITLEDPKVAEILIRDGVIAPKERKQKSEAPPQDQEK